MKENSIEEDIEILEKNIKSVKENADIAFFESNEDYYFFKAVEHILSDYKRVLKENEKINSLIKKLEKDSKEQQWIQTVDDEYLAYTEKAMYADELLSFLRGEE